MSVHISSGGRYPVLRTLAILFLVGVPLSIAGAIYWTWWEIAEARYDTTMGRVNMILAFWAAAFFSSLLCVGFAEGIKLFIDMEHHLRVAAMGSAGAAAGMNTGAVTTATAGDGAMQGVPRGRLLEGEETAEGALFRGH